MQQIIKRGSASIRTYRSSPAITITNMLDEINKWDTFKVDLPQDVQMKINGEALPKEHGKYTNLFSKGPVRPDGSIRIEQPNMSKIEEYQEEIRKDIKGWYEDYNVVREKFDAFSEKLFDDSLAEIYITGSLSQETKDKLVNDIIRNDFNAEYTGGKAKELVENFAKEAVDYYELGERYRANRKNLSFVRNANIVNQSNNGNYNDDYDEAKEADVMNKIAERIAKENKDSSFDYVKDLIDFGKKKNKLLIW